MTTGQPKTPILLLLGKKITTGALKLSVWSVNLGTTPKGHHTTPCPQHLIKRVGLIVNGRHTHTHIHTHTAHVWMYCTVCVQCTHTVHVVLETNFYTGHTLVQNTIGLDPLPHTYRDNKVQVSLYIYTYSVEVCMKRFRVSYLGKLKCACGCWVGTLWRVFCQCAGAQVLSNYYYQCM